MSHANVKLFKEIAQESLVQCHRMHSGCNDVFTFFVESLITTLEVRQIFTVEGLRNLMGENYMGNSQIRSFILTYETVFFANLGDANALYRDLYEIIADAVSISYPDNEEDKSKALLAPEVAEQVATYREACEVMVHNRWITSMMALILWTKPVYEFITIRTGNDTKQILSKVKTLEEDYENKREDSKS